MIGIKELQILVIGLIPHLASKVRAIRDYINRAASNPKSNFDAYVEPRSLLWNKTKYSLG